MLNGDKIKRNIKKKREIKSNHKAEEEEFNFQRG